MQVRITRPGTEPRAVRLPHGRALTVGRNEDADICLPDPERYVSREHFTLMLQGQEVKITLLSQVNSGSSTRGELKLGQTLSLGHGDELQVGAYLFVFEDARTSAPPESEVEDPDATWIPGVGSRVPWEADGAVPSERSPLGVATDTRDSDPSAIFGDDDPVGQHVDRVAEIPDFVAERGRQERSALDPVSAPLDGAARSMRSAPQDDGDYLSELERWLGKQSGAAGDEPQPTAAPSPVSPTPTLTAGPPLPPEPLRAPSVPPASRAPDASDDAHRRAIDALARGLQIDNVPPLTEDDWERIGCIVRLLTTSFQTLLKQRADARDELKISARTRLIGAGHDGNLLKSRLGEQDLLRQFLFPGERQPEFDDPTEAIHQARLDLSAHQVAIFLATRELLKGASESLSPKELLPHLTTGRRPAMFAVLEDARLWRAFVALRERQQTHMSDWIERMYDRYFVTAYESNCERLEQKYVAIDPLG